MKKCLLGFILLFLCLNIVYAQESYTKNTIYGGISTSLTGIVASLSWSPVLAAGLTIEYEHSFNDSYSVSIETGFDPMVIPYVEIKGRFYPWSNTFFVGLGTGIWRFLPSPFVNEHLSMSISPTIGWRINIGEQNRWVIMPSVTSRILINNRFSPWWDVYELIKININVGYKF